MGFVRLSNSQTIGNQNRFIQNFEHLFNSTSNSLNNGNQKEPK